MKGSLRVLVAWSVLTAGCSPGGCTSSSTAPTPPRPRAESAPSTPTPPPPPDAARDILPAVAQAMVDLEDQMRRDGDGGLGDRQAWRESARSATTPSALAAQLVALEAAMPASAMQDAWPAARGAWLQELRAASTSAAVARSLERFGASVRAAAMEDRWQSKNNAWLQRVQALR